MRTSIGRALELHVLLLEGELLAGRDLQHLLDEIEPGDELGHRMLHLEPRVHLEEIEIAVLVDDELDRAGGVVTDRLGQSDGLRSHRRARLGVEERARRLLDHLLIAALDRAFALIEMNDVAVLVAEHLDLDMPRLLDIFLDEHAVVAEARLGLRLRRDEAFLHLLAAIGDAHALAAAAGAGLDHHRIADLVGDLDRLLGVLDHAEMTGNRRDLRLRRELLRLDLVAHRLDGLDVGSDKHDAGLFERPGEGGVLRQEAVAGMDRLGAGRLGRGDDLADIEIGLGGLRRADRNGLVGHIDVQRVAVGLGIDRHGLDAEPARGPDDAAGDLAPIGDEQASRTWGPRP